MNTSQPASPKRDSRARTCLLFCLLALGAGCMPILPHADFIPEMVDATVMKERCWGIPSLEYRVEGITLTTQIRPSGDSRLRIKLQFDIPEGKTVELLSPDLTVITPDGSAKTLRIPGISLNENAQLKMEPFGPMVGRDFFIDEQRHSRHYWLFTPLDNPVPGELRVKLPPVKINDHIVTIPDITFYRELRVQFIAPLQC